MAGALGNIGWTDVEWPAITRTRSRLMGLFRVITGGWGPNQDPSRSALLPVVLNLFLRSWIGCIKEACSSRASHPLNSGIDKTIIIASLFRCWYIPLCLFVCLSPCLRVTYVYVSACSLSTWMLYMLVFTSVSLSSFLCIFTCMSDYLSVRPTSCLSVGLYDCLNYWFYTLHTVKFGDGNRHCILTQIVVFKSLENWVYQQYILIIAT